RIGPATPRGGRRPKMATATTPKDQVREAVPPPGARETAPRAAAPPRRSGWKIAIGIALVAVAGVAAAAKSGILHADARRPATPLYRVARAPLPITIKARGALESGKNREIVNKVEGQTTILFIVPD